MNKIKFVAVTASAASALTGSIAYRLSSGKQMNRQADALLEQIDNMQNIKLRRTPLV